MKTRRMVESDATEVAKIQVLAWQKGYENILPSAYLDSMQWQKKELVWKTGLGINPDVIRLVAEDNKRVLGYACGLENRREDLFPKIRFELWALYVHPEFWNQEIGTALISAFKAQINEKFLVWVLEENVRAQKFYEKAGGRMTGHSQLGLYGGREFQEIAFVFDEGSPGC